MISDCISDNMPPQMNILNMVIPILMHFCACLPLKSSLHIKLECCKLHKTACHQRKCDEINGVKLIQTVYCRYIVYGRKFLTLSNQRLCYNSKRINI